MLLIFFVLAVISGILSNKYGINIKRCSNVFTAMMLIYMGKYMFQTMKLKFDNGLLAIASAVMLYEVSVMYGGVSLNANKFPDIAALLAGCFSALYLIAYIGIRIEGSAVERFVCYCGKESFYIMALHLVGFKLCTMCLSVVGVNACCLSDLQPQVGFNIYLVLAYIAFGVLFPLAFIWAFRRVKRRFLR